MINIIGRYSGKGILSIWWWRILYGKICLNSISIFIMNKTLVFIIININNSLINYYLNNKLIDN